MKNYAQTSEDNQDSGTLSSPLSFLRSGFYYWTYAYPGNHGDIGYYWSLRSSHTTYSFSLGLLPTSLNPRYGDVRGLGFAVRCIPFTCKILKNALKYSY